MKSYSIRKIETLEDINQFRDLWCERSKRMKTPVEDQIKEFEKGMRAGVPVGAFDQNNILVGALRYRRLVQLPYMFLYNVHIKKDTLKRYDFTDDNNPITPILDYILETAENDNIYTWYYIRALSKGYYKLYKEGKDLLTQSNKFFDKESQKFRYERYIEEIIPSGEMSKYPGVRSWTGDSVWKPNVALFKCVLKNEYRVNGDLFDNELKYC